MADDVADIIFSSVKTVDLSLDRSMTIYADVLSAHGDEQIEFRCRFFIYMLLDITEISDGHKATFQLQQKQIFIAGDVTNELMQCVGSAAGSIYHSIIRLSLAAVICTVEDTISGNW